MSASDWSAFNEEIREFRLALNAAQARIGAAREALEGIEALTHHLPPAQATREMQAVIAAYRGES